MRGESGCGQRGSLVGYLLLFFHGQRVLQELFDLFYSFSLLSPPPDEDCGCDSAKETRGYQNTSRPRRAVEPKSTQSQSPVRLRGHTVTVPVEAPHSSTQNHLEDGVTVDKETYDQGGTVEKHQPVTQRLSTREAPLT